MIGQGSGPGIHIDPRRFLEALDRLLALAAGQPPDQEQAVELIDFMPGGRPRKPFDSSGSMLPSTS